MQQKTKVRKTITKKIQHLKFLFFFWLKKEKNVNRVFEIAIHGEVEPLLLMDHRFLMAIRCLKATLQRIEEKRNCLNT